MTANFSGRIPERFQRADLQTLVIHHTRKRCQHNQRRYCIGKNREYQCERPEHFRIIDGAGRALMFSAILNQSIRQSFGNVCFHLRCIGVVIQRNDHLRERHIGHGLCVDQNIAILLRVWIGALRYADKFRTENLAADNEAELCPLHLHRNTVANLQTVRLGKTSLNQTAS